MLRAVFVRVLNSVSLMKLSRPNLNRRMFIRLYHVAFESKDLEPSISNMYAFVNLCMQGDTVEIVQLHS